MFEKQQKLDVTQGEMAVIEAALHTQVKILNLQASAGGSGARRKLNEVKRVLAQISHQKKAEEKSNCRSIFCWFGFARTSS